MFNKTYRYAVFMVALAIAFSAGAAVTTQTNPDVRSFQRPASTCPSKGNLWSSQLIEPVRPDLARAAKELLSPPTATTYALKNTTAHQVKSLPPIPTAFFMTLTGFLSVSLIRDRKHWLSALGFMLSAGSAGLHALPKLTPSYHSITVNQIKNPLFASALYRRLEQIHLPRTELDGTSYVGLLRHLSAIPSLKPLILQLFACPTQLCRPLEACAGDTHICSAPMGAVCLSTSNPSALSSDRKESR